jgi:hypothetical protein
MEIKTCNRCSETKPVTEFHKGTNGAKYLSYCKSCRKVESAKNYRDKFFIFSCRLKKAYCRKHNLPFDLTPEYLESIWTEKCPVFDVPFVRFDKSHSHSPALDRVDPNKGYVKGNVKYICARANRIKYDATPEELLLVLDYMDQKDYNPRTSTPIAYKE